MTSSPGPAMSASPGPTPRRRASSRGAQLAPLPDSVHEIAAATMADLLAREKLRAAAAAGAPLVNRTGRQHSPITLPEYRRGRAPANKGKRYPPEILTADEIHSLLDAFPGGPSGIRSRALVVLLWRSGLRIAEALALRVQDVDLQVRAVTVLCGKGAKRRVVGVDAQALEYLRDWLQARDSLGVPAASPLFCTVSNDQGGRGRPLGSSAFRESLKHHARKAGIQKRVHPHGLRHTHAFELANEAIPLHVIQAQLGHNDLSMTSHYIDHLAPQQILHAIGGRQWPGGAAPLPVTRAAASQGAPAPRTDTRTIPAYTPAPREPAADPVHRKEGKSGPHGAAKAKLLAVLRANGGRATQSQLARALRVRAPTIARHCRELAGTGEIVRVGDLIHPARGGRTLSIWALPPLKAVYQLDSTVEFGSRARSGQGAERVLSAIVSLGGRASQSQLAGELGISSDTIGVHCRALEGRGRLERGGLDKVTSNRGSQVWKLPGRERFGSPDGPRLRIAGGSSTAGAGARAGRQP
jgi:integrase/DNA-binding Lrp family transcriptional regulator